MNVYEACARKRLTEKYQAQLDNKSTRRAAINRLEQIRRRQERIRTKYLKLKEANEIKGELLNDEADQIADDIEKGNVDREYGEEKISQIDQKLVILEERWPYYLRECQESKAYITVCTELINNYKE